MFPSPDSDVGDLAEMDDLVDDLIEDLESGHFQLEVSTDTKCSKIYFLHDFSVAKNVLNCIPVFNHHDTYTSLISYRFLTKQMFHITFRIEVLQQMYMRLTLLL